MIETYMSFSSNPSLNGFKIHNTGFKYHNLNKVYIPMKVNKYDLLWAINGALSMNVKGISISSPHKTSVIKYLHSYDEMVKKTQSCNTILNINGHLKGFNTDYQAVATYLGQDHPSHIFICGNGGYSKTIQKVCEDLGITFSIITRDNWEIIKTLNDQIIFNATPVVLIGDNIINASPNTPTGRQLALIQAAAQFSIYTNGLVLPIKECIEELCIDTNQKA